jgi:hypothetical protein
MRQGEMMKPPHKRAPLTREQKMFSRGLLSIFDGRKCIGHLLVRPHSGVEAFDSDDRSLGLFPDVSAAADAVSATEATR